MHFIALLYPNCCTARMQAQAVIVSGSYCLLYVLALIEVSMKTYELTAAYSAAHGTAQMLVHGADEFSFV